MSTPVPTTSALYPVRLREDLARDVAYAYWAGPHAEIVKRLPHVVEYNQHHFSATDHGYWPATPTVGTTVPSSWPLDGLTEVRMSSMAAGLRIPLHMREVFLDEQNVFEHVLGHQTGPRGGRWWTTGHDDTSVIARCCWCADAEACRAGHFVRSFTTRLGPALHAAGARDLRTYALLPLVVMAHTTFGVSHRNPPHRRYHGAVVFGTDTRAQVEDLIASPEVAAAVKDQHLTCTAVHAFGVDRTVPVIRTNTRDIDAAN